MASRRASSQPADPLALFHPRIASWFRRELGEPTEVQRLAWPVIAAGRHTLISSPTGSGKTLTAFLWALDRLLTGAWEGGQVRLLYVSPLRALNNDIRRNLFYPLAELERELAAAGLEPAPVRVETRSGDTPQSERRRMLRQPPEILITTPESLNILLTSRGGRSLLTGVRTVVLDEVHAVAGSKRGTHLITAVERLTLLSGEFQRLALSATIRPLERIARFVGGREPLQEGAPGAEPRSKARPVEIVEARRDKSYDLRVGLAGAEPEEEAAAAAGLHSGNPWEELAGQLSRIVRANRSTLVFANSRRAVEKLTRFLNDAAGESVAYSHHGSLSREIREVVERRLKEGKLAAIVATNSLELGIDIGDLDEVVMVQTPPTVASATQRLGRAGHRVGEVSRGRLYPLFPRDLLDAAVVTRCVLEGRIEQIRPAEAPLDVLAQVVLSMLAVESWQVDELYHFLLTIDPYRRLPRKSFELVLEMLAGRYADSRIRELRPRIAIDRSEGRVRARPGAARLIYLSGGTIPERGYFQLRHRETQARIGELDEEFVWERSVGDTFTLGAQSWRIRAITHNDVLVTPTPRAAGMAPFWRAEERDRGFFLSEQVGLFLEQAEGTLSGGGGKSELVERLVQEHRLERPAAGRLVELLERQRAATNLPLPHRRHLVVEVVSAGEGRQVRQAILHTLWGGRVNRPLALCLAAALEEELGYPLEVAHDNDALKVSLPDGIEAGRLLQAVRPDDLESLLRRRLERTGFFGARFRENAGRALLLPRAGFRRRAPLWLNRQRAKELLQAVAPYPDFPLLVETWRSCLEEGLDLDSLRRVLEEVERGEIEVGLAATASPSPFAADLVWKETNRLMYEDDTPEGGAASLGQRLLDELVFSSRLRPRLPAELVERFRRKLQRIWPGYSPGGARELEDWVRERRALPLGEWQELLDAMARDAAQSGAGPQTALEESASRLVRVELPGASGGRFVAAVEELPEILEALERKLEEVELSSILDDAAPPPGAALEALARVASKRRRAEEDRLASLVADWIRFQGPFPPGLLQETFGLGEESIQGLLETLAESEQVVIDSFRTGEGEREEAEICDRRNLERLLRLLRAESRPALEALPLELLPQFLAAQQGLPPAPAGGGGLRPVLERLFGYPAPAGLWESDLLPARCDPYYLAWLDSLLQESDLLWFGCGRERASFALAADLELFSSPPPAARAERLFAEDRGRGRYSFEELVESSGLGRREVAERLWASVWAGGVSNTTLLPLRQAVLGRFQPPEERPASPAGFRRRLERWGLGRPLAGDWYRLPAPDREGGLDALDREELARDRARQLLDRYGVLFRELLARELPALRWSRLFASLRLLELAGEVVSGQFFDGIPGPQFASPAAVRRLRSGLPDDSVYWMNALDPASPCGLGLEGFRGSLPARRPGSHLVFHGSRLVVVSRRNGARLEIRVEPDHPLLAQYLSFLKVLLTRQFQPLRQIRVESINGEPAASSPQAAALAEMFDLTREQGALRLRRRYTTG